MTKKSGRKPIPVEVGTRFGRGVVIRKAGQTDRQDGKNEYQSLLRCDCGNQYVASNSHLRRGDVLSCGCLFVETGRNKMVALHKGGNFMQNTGMVRNPKTGRYEKQEVAVAAQI